MQKVVLKAIVFFLGVLVAAWIFVDYKQEKSKISISKTNTQKDLENIKRGSLSPESKEIRDFFELSEEFRNFLNSLPEEKQQALFRAAVVEGTYSSLQKINSRILNSFSNYRSTILPDLKKQVLQELLNRFRESDWLDWSNSSFANDGEPTLARSYVDTISLVNIELANYLETAAYLFSNLYRRIMAAEDFQLDQEFEALASSYEKRKKSADDSAPQMMLDASILEDANFLASLERIKRSFILRYVRKNPNNLLTNLNLLLSIELEAAGKEELEVIDLMIRKFTLDASPKYREEVFKVINNSINISEFIKINSALRQSLSQLYVVGALDAVENQDLKKANIYLDQSIVLYPKLRSQEILGDYIKYGYQNNALSNAKKGNLNSDLQEKSEFDSGLTGLNKNSSEDEVSRSMKKGFSYLLIILFVVVTLGLAIIVFFYYKSSAARKEEEAQNEKETAGNKENQLERPDLTPDIAESTEMDFEKEFQIGRRANLD